MVSTDITSAIEQFVQDITYLPSNQSLDDILHKAILAEHKIRSLFASDPHNLQLRNLFLGLIDIFSLDPAARHTRERQIDLATSNVSDHYVFPVDSSLRRPDFMPSIVPDIMAFQENWNIFTHGALSAMSEKDWENIVVAGGSVLACLNESPQSYVFQLLMPQQPNISALSSNEFYQSNIYGTSDIDMFIWGLLPEEAKVKMEHIYRVVCTAAPWKVICVRKANTISIHTNYPYRPIQIILRLYQSPAEILAGFDIDAACCAYDGQEICLYHATSPYSSTTTTGQRVWVNPRSLVAVIRQANTVDMTRRSPSYEIRLAKYAERGFEVYIPSLDRKKINPSIYAEELPVFPKGLACLLVLEAAYYRENFYKYLKYPKVRIMKRKVGSSGRVLVGPYEGMEETTGLVCKNDPEDMPGGNTEELVMSNYDSSWGWAQIPYGPSWTADKIKSMILRTDASMNSPYNPYNKEGDFRHRHVFFAGTMQQCLGAFCSDCADFEPHAESSTIRPSPSTYIQGPVSFMTVNPGRQLITGSFRPIDVGEWASEAYERQNHCNEAITEVDDYELDPESALGDAASVAGICRCC